MTNGHVLITGAAGFIGSHLCDKFMENGWKVTGVDNFITGRPDNIKHLFGVNGFNLVEADITEDPPLYDTYDLVLHFASPASPEDYFQYPIETMRVNSIGSFNALEIAHRCGARCVYASTSEVYGDPDVHPQVESYWGNVNPVGVRSAYDEAKRFSEALMIGYHRKHGIDVRICRIFNTYGPRMRPGDGRVIPNFIIQALAGKPLTVYGNGMQTRSFCYIGDLVEGVYRLAVNDGLGGVIMNIGNPNEYSIIELAQTVRDILNPNSQIEFKPLPEDDPRKRNPDISLARSVLGWSPKVILKNGLLLTAEYFQRQMIKED